MKMIVLCVFDRALGAYGRPFVEAARGVGVRAFQDAVRDPQSPFHKHPEDFELWQLASFDDQDGTFLKEVPKERIALASDFVQGDKS